MGDNEALVQMAKWFFIGIALCVGSMAGCEAMKEYCNAIEVKAAMENGYEKSSDGWMPPAWKKTNQHPQ